MQTTCQLEMPQKTFPEERRNVAAFAVDYLADCVKKGFFDVAAMGPSGLDVTNCHTLVGGRAGQL